jgi:hypothetical protein
MAACAISWLATRIPAVNTVFAYTTLTRAYRRYHEPGRGGERCNTRDGKGDSPAGGTVSFLYFSLFGIVS